MKVKFSIYLFLLLLLINTNISAQREANIWYFGTFAGVDFNSGTPIPLTDGKINRWEGVASISDSLGNLKMYTDGDTVWNAQHTAMPNGYGLLGEPSSTESAIIIPYPLHDSLYIIFTVDAEGGSDGLCYSIVNMNLDNGLGDIETKNFQLETPVSEKVTAVRHKNNRDFWVISHGWETDSFFVYLVTPNGVNLPPQIYEIGTPHSDIGISGNNAVGYMRASPDGSKLACVLQVKMITELYDFNNETGEITNPVTIPADESPYGVEFSPNASKMYFTSRFSLFQVDLTNPNPDSIINSVTFIDSSQTQNFFGAVQVATDGKIYLAHEFSNYLGVINNPSAKGDSCNFELNGLFLDGRQSRMGLPDFIQTFFLPPDFKHINYCLGDSTMFFIDDTTGIDSVLWNFNDTLSTENISKEFRPKHRFSKADLYLIQLTMWRNGVDYHKERIIKINPLPDINLGNDTIICSGSNIILDANYPNCIYLWNDFSTDSTFSTNLEGSYSATVTDTFTNCYNSDTIKISLSPLPIFNLGNDTGFCKFNSLLISVNYPNVDFLWNTGNTDSSIIVHQSGNYSLKIMDSLNCSFSDTLYIDEYNLPIFSLGNDTIICPNTSILLKSDNFEHYLWNDSSTFSTFNVSKAGLYWLKVTDTNNCKSTDSIVINEKEFPFVNLGNDTIICEDDFITLTVKNYDFNYLWNDESSKNSLITGDSGTYWVQVSNICGTKTDSIHIKTEYCGEIYIPNIITPNEDGINDFFRIKGIAKEAWTLYIYNRWGDLIFLSNDYKNDWSAENSPDGTYYYILQKNTDKTLIYKGFIQVYRGN